MSSSIVSAMHIFLFLLLVFPHMDSALGEQMHLRRLMRFGAEEIHHHDQVTVRNYKRALLIWYGPPPPPNYYKGISGPGH